VHLRQEDRKFSDVLSWACELSPPPPIVEFVISCAKYNPSLQLYIWMALTRESPVHYFQFVPQWAEFPHSFTVTCKKNHHYKQKCNSLRYKHCDTHTSTSLLCRLSTKTSWLFPLHHFTHTMCLRVHFLSGFSWLVSVWGNTGLFAVQNWLDHAGIHTTRDDCVCVCVCG
jgi:hypothetical protein